MEYESIRQVESTSAPGVRFQIRRMSFGRRIEFTKRVRSLGEKLEFLQAGESAKDRVEAALVSSEINRVYLEWGLAGVDGLCIDGSAADPARLIETGPESLCDEVLRAIKQECGLSEEERKN